jgi:CheY-like chemotaxis protein
MKVRILHLEDNDDDAALVRMSLARSGLPCKIVQVSNGEGYRKALQAPQFDVILSDSGVPGYDGEAARAAARACCPDIPFIIVSGGDPRPEEPAPVAERISLRVPKTDLASLAPAIRQVLSRADSTAKAAEAMQSHADRPATAAGSD